MIIGEGMIAKSFEQYDSNDFLIFASGVSNSKTTNIEEFEREKDLLVESITKYENQVFVYFSSCSITNNILGNDLYHQHKINMENIIKCNVNNYLIFRLSNVVGNFSINSKTLVPFFIEKILYNKSFNVWSGSVRNIIGIQDVVSIVIYILKNKLYMNETLYIANKRNIRIINLINKLELVLNKKANYKMIKTVDENFTVNLEKIEPIIKALGISFNEKYLDKILINYCKELRM